MSKIEDEIPEYEPEEREMDCFEYMNWLLEQSKKQRLTEDELNYIKEILEFD